MAQVRISEFLADNTRTLMDSEGKFSDWLELENESSEAVSLTGYHLTDEEAVPTKWQFPAVDIPPRSWLVVFASGKGQALPGDPLHTNFRLSRSGGFLALLAPDGVRVIQAIRYGAQRADISQGLGRRFSETPLVGRLTDVRIQIPTEGDLDWRWREADYEDSLWMPARMGIGFDVAYRVPPSLIAFWDFNNTVQTSKVPDRGERHHDGSLIRASLSVDSGGRTAAVGDRALNLAGTGLMDVPGASGSMFATAIKGDAVTVSLWIRGDKAQPSNDSLFWAGSRLDGSGTRSLNAHVPWSDQVIYWDTGCCDASLNRVSIPDPDPSHWRTVWNHYAFVKSGTVKEIWQNGKRLIRAVNTDKLSPIASFFLGATTRSGGAGYHGLIDDAGLFEEALGEAEIQALAAGESPLRWHLLRSLIHTELPAQASTGPAAVRLRAPFAVANGASVDTLRFRVRYNDGFVAFLNGVEVARRNATGNDQTGFVASSMRAVQASTIQEEFFVAGVKLKPGTNVLAVLALNHELEMESLLFDLEMGVGETVSERFFGAPTPGAANPAGVAGFLEAAEVEPGRGFYDENTAVVLKKPSPGSTLVYTTDGSWPGATNGLRMAGSEDRTSLPLTNTTLLRVGVFRDDHQSPPIQTHTYIMADRVASQKAPRGIDSNWAREASADFAIDARVVNNPKGPTFQSSLRSLPVLSLGTPTEDMFGSRGLYRNPEARDDSWERKASVEWFNAGKRVDFATDAGLRIHGNVSRQKNFTPKHSFSLVFRSEYGPSRLNYPMFPDSTEGRFNRLVLRGGSTDTWAGVEWDQRVDGVLRWYRKDASYVRDQWVRDALLAMGQPAGHGVFSHLFVNGLYWGVYNLCERPDADFAAAYLGGESDEYDVLADYTELRSGNRQAWDQLISAASANLAQTANYQKLLGNTPDGTRNPALPVLLDVTNLVDYMILHVFIGADDWPNHNWWAARRRGTNSAGFKFFPWDQEISINSLVKQHTSSGPIYAEAGTPGTPSFVYSRCRANAEFRQLFADRVQLHLFDGALCVSSNRARWDRLSATVDASMVAESARWGDVWRSGAPYRREVEWLANHGWMQSVYFPSNHAVALKRFRTAKLYPVTDPPMFVSTGDETAGGASFRIVNPNSTGSVYYTLDGTDPRSPGGGVAASAQLFVSAVNQPRRGVILARVRTATEWSAVVRLAPAPDRTLEFLQLSEIDYHPEDWMGVEGDEFEFIEFVNTGAAALDLGGLRISNGIRQVIAPGTRLGAGEFLVLARDPAKFHRRYPNRQANGGYDGGLNNEGDSFTLTTLAGISKTFEYGFRPPWPEAAAGGGASLQRRRIQSDENDPGSWVAAAATPGTGFAEVHRLLEITMIAGQQIRLRWKGANQDGTVLESTESLPSARWIPASLQISDSDGWREAILQPARSTSFYRVAGPRP